MSLDEATVRSWDATRTEREWRQRVRLRHQLVGWLYTSVVTDELDLITAVSDMRWKTSPGELSDRGIAYSTRTDGYGVVHDGRLTIRCAGLFAMDVLVDRDEPPREAITCIECVGITTRG